MPVTGLVTTESGGKATFTIVLARAPSDNVIIGLSSSNTKEGTVSPMTVTFTAENYNAPQMVQVTGVDDDAEDGPQVYTVRTSPATSEDTSFFGLDALDPQVTNTDNDTAGVTLMPPSGLVTTESGGEATFTVQLNHAPTADVTIALSTDKPSEGTVSPASLTFTSVNWMAPQTVTVTGVNDDAKDGPQKFAVLTSATSQDPKYNGIEVADEEVTNKDNDTAGMMVVPTTRLLTFESGMMSSFTLALSSPPTADVTVSFESTAMSEGTVSPTSVLFTTTNWMAPQVVSVTGVDDTRVDGDQPYQILASVTQTQDADYRDLMPVKIDVTNVDDDSPGILLEPTEGLKTGEDLTAATFTVALKSKPGDTVTLAVESSRPEEGVATPPTLTFTEENWDAPQTVTVMGVDDKVADGAQTYIVHVRPDGAATKDLDYVAVLEQDAMLSNVDNDSAGVTLRVEPTTLTTTEQGGTATFTIRLNSQPTADVTIGLSTTDATEGTVSPAKVTFTPENYGSEQVVTVRGVNDDVADGNQPYRIITETPMSNDPNYARLDVPNVDVINIDDDSAGFLVESRNKPLVTAENGQTDTFTVRLTSKPRGAVTIAYKSSNEAEGIASPSSLRFTDQNWNAPQTVTVKGQPDSRHDGPQGYRIVFGEIKSDDPDFGTNVDRIRPLDVKCSNIDDDSPSIRLINASGLTTTEKNAGTATFQVALGSEPADSVTIALSSSRTSEGNVSPKSLTFTVQNWASPQMVTVTGVDEKVQDGPQQYFVVFAPSTSNDNDYKNQLPNPSNVTITNLDDDTAGVRVVASPTLATAEPNVTATFTVELTSQPTADVTIPLLSSKTSEGTVSPASLTFTAANWNAPRTVTLTGGDDPSQDGDQPYVISLGPINSQDAKYKVISIPDVKVVNKDNDTAKILVSAISGDTTEANQGTAFFTIALQTKPTAEVTVPLSSKSPKEGTVNPASVTFNTVNWASPQRVTVTGVDDPTQDGDQPYTIDVGAASSQDGNYNLMDPADVAVVNRDNDTAGIIVTKVSNDTSESGGTATFTVVLRTKPSNKAMVALTMMSSNTAEGTLSDSSITFTDQDWASPRTVTITGVEDDGTADRDQPFTVSFGMAMSADGNYMGKQPAALSFTNRDNDTAGVIVKPLTGATSEEGETMSFTVVLQSKPKADVKIPISSSDMTEGTVSTSQLTFTTANWKAAQTVTVTGVNDEAHDNNATYTVFVGTPISTDTDYTELDPPDVSLTNEDDDVAGFVVVQPTTNTSESGATTTFSIRLRSKPSADVTIGLSTSDDTEGTLLNVTKVVLTPDDWSTPHVVTIHGENDDVEDGEQPYTIITDASSSTDADYDNKVVPDISVKNDDNDTAGYTVSLPSGNTNEDGGTATFTVVLKSKPTADVTIPVSSNAPLEGTVSPSSLLFTTANWKVAQTVTVTGVNDDVADGGIDYKVVLGKPSSTDTKYAQKDPPDVDLTNDDNDSAAFNITMPATTTTSESASAAGVTFSVVLSSKPKATVTIPLMSSNEMEGIITEPADGALTFDATNWSKAQTVTVMGVDDVEVDGSKMYSIRVGPPDTTDAGYKVLPAQLVNLENLDDD